MPSAGRAGRGGRRAGPTARIRRGQPSCARLSSRIVGVQDPQAVRGHAARRGTAVVQRQGRHAATEEAVRCLTRRARTIDRLVRLHAADDGGQADGDRSRRPGSATANSTRAQAIWPRHSSKPASARAPGSGLVMPNSVRWVQIAIALTRIGAVLVPLSTLLQAGELVAQLRTASVQFLVSVEEFRGHRYLDDLRSAAASNFRALRARAWPRRLDVGTAAAWRRERARADRRRAGRDGDRQRPAGHHVHLRQQRQHPRASCTRTATHWARCDPGLASRCIDSDTRLYLPMPFFWVGGFGSGMLSALLAGATLVTEEIPQPETTLRLLERERVTLFRGWPDQAEALARHPDSRRRRSVGAAAGQPGSPAAARAARLSPEHAPRCSA